MLHHLGAATHPETAAPQQSAGGLIGIGGRDCGVRPRQMPREKLARPVRGRIGGCRPVIDDQNLDHTVRPDLEALSIAKAFLKPDGRIALFSPRAASPSELPAGLRVVHISTLVGSSHLVLLGR